MKKIILLTVCFIFCSNISFAKKENNLKIYDPLSVYTINNCGDTTGLEIQNASGFFKVDDKLYLIAWKMGGCFSNKTHRIKSVLASTRLGDNSWKTVPIKGEAFFDPVHNQLVTTDKEKDWKIRFFTLDGTQKNEITLPYKKQRREIRWYWPTPIVDKNGSIILYYSYPYETRNIVAHFILDLMSGGHGGKPRFSNYIHVLDSASKNSKVPLKYYEVIDAVKWEKFFPYGLADDYLQDKSSNTVIEKDYLNDNTEVTKYEILDEQAIYHKTDNGIVRVSRENIQIITPHSKKTIPVPDHISQKKITNVMPYTQQVSDIYIDDNDNLYYVFYSGYLPGNFFFLYFYDQSAQTWKTYKLKLGQYLLRKLEVHAWKNHVYIAFWLYDDLYRVEVMHVKLN